MNDESSLWWEYTSGPSRFISDVKEAAVKNVRAIAIVFGSDAAYMGELRDSVVNYYLQGVRAEYIPCEISEADMNDFDGYIVSQIAPEDALRRRNGESAAQFILRTNCLDKKILWLSGVSVKSGGKVSSFLKEFGEKCGSSSGKIVAEGALSVNSKSVKTFVLDEYLDGVDVESFALNLYRKRRPKELYIIYKYVSALASAAYGKNAARAENLINGVEDFVDGDLVNFFTGENGDEKRSKRIVHRAQQQIFNPLLEEFRLALAEKYEKYFNEAISKSKIKVDYPKDDIKDAYDLQIGHMNYLVKRKLPLANKIDSEAVDIIKNDLYEARNKLAHIVPLTPHEVKRLCELIDYFGK